jgi:hypothetical protein
MIPFTCLLLAAMFLLGFVAGNFHRRVEHAPPCDLTPSLGQLASWKAWRSDEKKPNRWRS